MSMHRQKEVNRPPEDSPVAWFLVLERARIERDFVRAAEAQRQLERLGVKVRYQHERKKGGMV
jgi:hypothetical protein